MTLREDSDQYCFLWMGVLFFSAYYWNILIGGITWVNYLTTMLLISGPVAMLFFFMGYLRPVRGKIKSTMLSIAVFIAALFTIAAFQYHSMGIDAAVFTASWGIGSSILTAGGFSMMTPVEIVTSPGQIDTSKLHYGPPVEEVVEEVVVEEAKEVEDPPVTEESATEPSSE